MIKNTKKQNLVRQRRVFRVRKRLKGNAERPRLSVFKSNLHLSVQLINDETGITLASVGTMSKELKGTEYEKKSKKSAQLLGEKIAKMAKDKNVEKVVFDRGRFKYHGIIATLADAARQAGLQF
ncbi:MAG: 50S ribosomal protein L18 [Chlamydiae bacterium]|jgi:large subunit ribosomal protein L18|nr:50S ribosomal protein L18 [Chlamydiota bacterium]